jgi:hypothetical protein
MEVATVNIQSRQLNHNTNSFPTQPTPIHESSLSPEDDPSSSSSDNDSVSVTSESPSSTKDEPSLPWQIQQARESLRIAIYTTNQIKTTAEFLDAFSMFTEESTTIQHAVKAVEQTYQHQKSASIQAIHEARDVYQALSSEEQRSMMLHYGDDLQYFIEIVLPLDLLVDISEKFGKAQDSLFKTEDIHRALARVRGMVAMVNGVVLGPEPSFDRLRRENREREQELLSSRAVAEEGLQGQFFELNREDQDRFWLWYKDFMGMSGILKTNNGPSYSIMS